MSNTKKNTTPAALRAAANEAVENWRSLQADADAKRAEAEQWYQANPLPQVSFVGQLRSSPLLLAHIGRQIAVAEAEGRAAVAERAAVLSLDAAELAEGDEAARARDLPTLKADLFELDADVQKAREALVAAQRRFTERVGSADKAKVLTAYRRREAALPYAFAAVTLLPGRRFTDAVDEAIAKGIPTPGFAARVADLRAQQTKVAFECEEARIEKEAEAREKAEIMASRERRDQDANRRMREQAEASRREAEDERKRREELAAAHLQRLA